MKNFTLGIIVGSIIGGTTGAIAAGGVLRVNTLMITSATNEKEVGVLVHTGEDSGGIMINSLKNASFSHMIAGKIAVGDSKRNIRAAITEEGFIVLDNKERIAATLTEKGLNVIPEYQRKSVSSN